MLVNLLGDGSTSAMALVGLLVAFFGTALLIALLKKHLPGDQGRAFAVNGEKSKGKPRGAGVIFVPVFGVCALLFIPFSIENLIYVVLVILAMLSGYLDDRSEKPWGEYKKALIDLVLAVGCAITYAHFNGTHIQLFFTDSISFTMPTVPFVILAVILVWTSINVTNCSDGVDGLCGTLSVITFMTVYGILSVKGIDTPVKNMIVFFAVGLLAYLLFNASPSMLLMGDAGSRAIGFFIAIIILKTGSPFLYIPAAIVLILDGGLGLIKVFLKRFLKINFFPNVRFPLHDHMRKNKGWSDTQVVIRFGIVQFMISAALLFAATL